MRAHRYSFRHVATVPAPPGEVAEVLLDLEHYPDWWPQVRAVASLGPDDALVVCRSALPYDLELRLHAQRRTTDHLEVAIDGPIRGFARWELTARDDGTQMTFTQEVEATGRVLRAASYVARPALRWNHEAMMRGCVQGLAQALASPDVSTRGHARASSFVRLLDLPLGANRASPGRYPHDMSESSSPDLLDRARAWATADPDPATKAELEALIEAADEASMIDLADRFRGTLEFGTAGLRGALGAGPNRMNRVVVLRAAAGLAAYLQQIGDTRPVVIGYDARHNSDVFARDTAEVMTGAGIPAYTLNRPLPTPLLAYAIRDLGCSAGVMVTASHNPPQDNGYKVYLGDGSQIVPPADVEIAALIAAVGDVAAIPRGDGGEVLDDAILGRYLESVQSVVEPGPRDLTIVYTPLHGVGGSTVQQALADAGFRPPHEPPAQSEPDGSFPTVSFPNPEEPGAMDQAMALAAEVGADIVVANDPDADRCAVALPGPHGWQMLRGDEVGALLADHLLRSGKSGVYAQSIVSSSLLGKMAATAGQPHQETLTGFKWIGRIDGLAFGYEEALGYCVDPDHVKDKDGVSAVLLVCDIAARAKAEGRGLRDLLDDIAVRHGLHATDQLSVRFTDLDAIPATMQLLREAPPSSLGGLAVERVEDLSEGTETLPPTDGLRYTLADQARVIVRPSGTEPKIKCYLEVVVPVAIDDGGVDAARIAAVGRLDAIKGDVQRAAGL